jgi:excisionase family DNA binding protein
VRPAAVLDVHEASRCLGVGLNTVYRLIQARRLRRPSGPQARPMRVYEADVRMYEDTRGHR